MRPWSADRCTRRRSCLVYPLSLEHLLAEFLLVAGCALPTALQVLQVRRRGRRTGTTLKNPSTTVDAKLPQLQRHHRVRQATTKRAAVRWSFNFLSQRPPGPRRCPTTTVTSVTDVTYVTSVGDRQHGRHLTLRARDGASDHMNRCSMTSKGERVLFRSSCLSVRAKN